MPENLLELIGYNICLIYKYYKNEDRRYDFPNALVPTDQKVRGSNPCGRTMDDFPVMNTK